MYLRDGSGRVHHLIVIGETRMSWLTGNQWRPYKYPKRDYVASATKEEYDKWLWATEHGYAISRRIYNYSLGVTPHVLRQIADLIGYDTEAK
jgi:hypothetical protein